MIQRRLREILALAITCLLSVACGGRDAGGICAEGDACLGRVAQALSGVTADRSSYASSDPITVSWTGAPGYATDWVAVVPESDDVNACWDLYGTWHWVYTDGATAGSATFTGIPEGRYVARLFENDGCTQLAVSSAFAVGSAGVSSDRLGYGQFDSVQITWTGAPGYATDWVAVVPESDDVNACWDLYGTWHWVYTNGATTGSASFAGLPGGRYVARLFENDGCTQLAASPVFAVVSIEPQQGYYSPNSPITLAWSGAPGNGLDWVAVSQAGSSSTDYVEWAYTEGALSGTTTIQGLPEGSYVARVYENDTYAMLTESGVFHVGGVVVTTDDTWYSQWDAITVSWSGAPGNATDWVTIISADPQEGRDCWDPDSPWWYTDGAPSGTVSRSGAPSGECWVRLYANDGCDLLAETSIQVAGISTLGDQYRSMETVEVQWEGAPPIPGVEATVALAGSSPDAAVAVVGSDAASSGFFLTSPLAAGHYVARLRVGSELMAESDTFFVTDLTSDKSDYGLAEVLTVNWSGAPGGVGDRIVIAPIGSLLDDVVQELVTGVGPTGTQSVVLQVPVGSYVLRLLRGSDGLLAAETPAFSVEDDLAGLDIGALLDSCPQEDPAYAQLRDDFLIGRAAGEDATPVLLDEIHCTAPVSQMSEAELSDELAWVQAFRVVYHMNLEGTSLPWAPGVRLYDWMKARGGGVSILPAGEYGFAAKCCTTFHGRTFIQAVEDDPSDRAWRSSWEGISGRIGLLSHEFRHRETGNHLRCCTGQNPDPTSSNVCDQAYDLSHLEPYGVSMWLHAQWLTGAIYTGFSCLPPDRVNAIASWHQMNAVGTPSRFCSGDGLPTSVAMPVDPGGACRW